MRLPRKIQRVLCAIGTDLGINRLHQWKRGRRVNGFLVRRCAVCRQKQEQTFPGGHWLSVSSKRVRRPALKPETLMDEQRRDAEQGMAP